MPGNSAKKKQQEQKLNVYSTYRLKVAGYCTSMCSVCARGISPRLTVRREFFLACTKTQIAKQKNSLNNKKKRYKCECGAFHHSYGALIKKHTLKMYDHIYELHTECF